MSVKIPAGTKKVETCLLLLTLGDELKQARAKHPQPMVDYHHGYGVLMEEVRELEVEIFKRNPDPERVQSEALQIAAMALRLIEDVSLPAAMAKGKAKR